MNSVNPEAASFSIANSVQGGHANPYGDANQMRRSAIKAPIPEKLNNSMATMARSTWRVIIVAAAILAIGSLFMSLNPTPLFGPRSTPLATIVFVANIIAGALLGIGLICAPIFAVVVRKQTKQIEQMQQGHYLARWDLDQKQWTEYIEEEKTKSEEAKSTAAIIMVVMGLLMWYPFSGILSPLTCISGIVALGLAGYLMGWSYTLIRKLKLDRMSSTPMFSVISLDGLYFQNGYYAYSNFGSGLDNVDKVKTGAMHYLVFTFYNETKNGRTETERRVPVPRGKEKEADWVVKQLK